MKREPVLTYIRVSSEEQKQEGYSPEAQRFLLQEYADRHDMEIIELFEDVETAKRPGRPKFDRMIELVTRSQGPKTIIVEKTDRLYRNYHDTFVVESAVLNQGVSVHFVKENFVLSRDSRASEKFLHGLRALMAKHYIDNLSEECRKGMKEKAREGYWPSYAPVGYTNVEVNGRRSIIPDPVLGPIVASLFQHYANGDLSIRELAKLARKLGLTTRGKHRVYGPASIQRILRNPIYKGDVVWNGVSYPGHHQPLVSRELWNRVQELLDQKRTNKGRRVKYDYLFARTIRCGHCGGLITGQEQKGHVYYHCSGYHGKCPEPYTREEALEKAFLDILRSLEGSEVLFGWVEKCLNKRAREWEEIHDSRLTSARQALVETKQQFERLYDDYLKGRLPEWLYEKRAAELSQAITEHTAEVAKIEADIPVDVERLHRTFELARKASASYSSLTYPGKRKLVRSVLSNCTWKDGRLDAVLSHPYDLIADASVMVKAGGNSEATEKAIYLLNNDCPRPLGFGDEFDHSIKLRPSGTLGGLYVLELSLIHI